ncbi:M23 family metallopeptidase [Actinobaculum massiliense]|mgnify:CR=1 FL=1|uniref:M23ase beta-sheet core domain-containing protein n=1 Tax=Actinobaculum massiliense ACS-171-V-Col2 TaxID=883066 RepID=K9F2A6_9ACTO|nr:M23 family metallopeptidase [Actinobaculum massiliense]EKU95620.1 hypothetical protein HMPREF9233_00407 [Actinobaculum massiliense ACS-171-V-Col2]MDK8319003.1 M23 family metallopeptidase [Actinobaculum massiliense]MDK8567638.1 M23 family metallopeptidase [Actinobaculum massiliense]
MLDEGNGARRSRIELRSLDTRPRTRREARLAQKMEEAASARRAAKAASARRSRRAAHGEGLSIEALLARAEAPTRRAAKHAAPSVEAGTEVLSARELATQASEAIALGRSENEKYAREAHARQAEACQAEAREADASRAPRFDLDSARRRLVLFGTAVAAALAIPAAMTLQGSASQPLTESVVATAQAEWTTPASLTGASTAELRSQAKAAAQTPSLSCATTGGASGTRAALAVPTSNLIVMPLQTGVYRVSSPFGARVDPITGGASVHAGQDYAAPAGTPIHAVADGTVLHAGEGIEGRSNNLIIVEHQVGDLKFQSWYIHMYDDGVLVQEGDVVKAGQIIGTVGSNGYSTGPHLHLEIHDAEGELVDPAQFLTDHAAVPVEDLCS